MLKSVVIPLGIIISSMATMAFGHHRQPEMMNPRKRQQPSQTAADDPMSVLESYCPAASDTVTVAAYVSCTSSVVQSIKIACDPQEADCDCAFTQGIISSCVKSICPSNVVSALEADGEDCKGGLVTSGLTAMYSSTGSSTATDSSLGASETGDHHHDEDGHHSGLSTGAIAGIAVGAFAAGTALVAACVCLFLRRRRKNIAQKYDAINQASNFANNSSSGLPQQQGQYGQQQQQPPPPGTPGFPHSAEGAYAYHSQATTPGSAGFGGFEQKMGSTSPQPGMGMGMVPGAGVAQPGQVYEAPAEAAPVFEVSGESAKRW